MLTLPDLSDPYWRCGNTSTDTVLQVNHGRLFYSHYLRVIAARIRAEQVAPVLLLPRVSAVRAADE